MSSSGSAGKLTRTFGSFAPDSQASSLFDAAFSKPVSRRRWQKSSIPEEEKDSEVKLPSVVADVPSSSNVADRKLLSPPVSLPESNASDGNIEQSPDVSDDDDLNDSPPVQATAFRLKLTERSGKSFDSKRAATSSFDFEEDFDEPPPSKRQKTPEEDSDKMKFFKKENRPVYKHTWSTGYLSDEEDLTVEKERKMSPIEMVPNSKLSSMNYIKFINSQSIRAPIWKSGPSVSAEPSRHTRVRNVKEAHECLESGEHDDFKSDLEYILSSLKDPAATTNTKCLSTITLARKCISSGFRQFIRSKGMVNVVFRALADAPSDQDFALCSSAVIYLMCRDFVSMKVDAASLRLLSNLLRMEKVNEPSNEKFYSQVSDVFDSYLEKMESGGKKIQFDIDKDQMSPSSLVLEALVFILARNTEEGIKTELLNLGALQWVVLKVEKIVLRLGHDTLSDLEAKNLLIPLERCFRILELCTLFHKKNQAFLISHRGSVLIHSCAKLLSVQHSSISKCEANSELAVQQIACLSLMARVLMNLSHENELCCTKLGQIPGFLSLCLSSFTLLAPKYAPEDKKFDLYVMMCSLLVNLVERCNANRRKVIDARVLVYERDMQNNVEKTALEALTQLFLYHESAAKTIDEDLEKDLVMEEPENDSDGDDARNDGRLDRGKMDDLSEAEMVMHVQSAMNKASAHMEDSVVASYVALLIGCLLQQNEDAVARVKELLPNNKLDSMVDQLQRFLEFMKLASNRKGSCRSIEKIIGHLERLNSE